MLYFSVLWSLLSQCNFRFNGNQSLPQATLSSHMPFLLQLLMTNLYKQNDLSLLTSIMLVLVLLVFTRLQLFRLPQSDTKVKGKLFITRYQINLFFLIFLIELHIAPNVISVAVFANLRSSPNLQVRRLENLSKEDKKITMIPILTGKMG